MEYSSKDPSGHLKLTVSDFQKSNIFYSLLFDMLGFEQISIKEQSAGWVTPQGFGIWIAQAKITDLKPVFSAPGFHHLCLKATSPQQVDAIYTLMKNQTFIFDPPQKYSKYTEKYYAFFFADPDGMKLEVAYY
ncbi:VOC family protein [Candidatus Woesearchaeota archaeon]|nr:VOC family protein [Candidatus Woesearchaeota archaeon]